MLLPQKPRPAVIIVAGSIVSKAHLPAYRKAGFSVTGIGDPGRKRARRRCLAVVTGTMPIVPVTTVQFNIHTASTGLSITPLPRSIV